MSGTDDRDARERDAHVEDRDASTWAGGWPGGQASNTAPMVEFAPVAADSDDGSVVSGESGVAGDGGASEAGGGSGFGAAPGGECSGARPSGTSDTSGGPGGFGGQAPTGTAPSGAPSDATARPGSTSS